MLRRKTPLRRRTKMRLLSDKRSKELREYTRLRHQYLTDHPLCEVCRKNRSGQIHHKRGRSHRQLLVTEEWCAICHDCHTQIHRHGRASRNQGLLK